MQNNSLRKSCISSFFGFVAGAVMFYFGASRAPVVPLHLASCAVFGMAGGIAMFLMQQVLERESRGQMKIQPFKVVLAAFGYAFVLNGLTQNHFVSWQQQKQFALGLDLQKYGVAMFTYCLAFTLCEIFVYLQNEAAPQEEV